MNVNEITKNSGENSVELEKAKNLINELKNKLQMYEKNGFAVPQPTATVEEDQVMAQEGPSSNNFENMSQSQQAAIAKSQEISSNAMKDQVRFMTESIETAKRELEEKQLLIHTIEAEKREISRKHDALEVTTFELQEQLTVAQIDAE